MESTPAAKIIPARWNFFWAVTPKGDPALALVLGIDASASAEATHTAKS